jgi:hypothetical protein
MEVFRHFTFIFTNGWSRGWIPALLALVFFSILRGTVAFASVFTIIFLIGAYCEYRKPSILFSPGNPIVVSAVLFILISVIAIWRYRCCGDPGDVDFACYTNVLWNTLHGHFLFNSFHNENLMAVHSSLAVLLFLPFYLLAGNIGLIISQNLAWCIGLYLFVYSSKNRDIPWPLFVAVAVSPCIIPAPFFGFHPDILVIPFSAWVLITFQKKQLYPFLIASIMLFFAKEVFALIIFTFSLIAIIEKRKWQWILFPALLSSTLFLSFWYVLSPSLRANQTYVFSNMLPTGIGASFQALASPVFLIFVLIILLAYSPLLASSKKQFLFFPLGLILFYGILPDNSFKDIWRHYVTAIGAVSLFPLVYAESTVLKKIMIPLFLIAFGASTQWAGLFFGNTPIPKYERVTLESAIRTVPKGASLIIHAPCISKAAGRYKIGNWIYRPRDWRDYDYVLFDADFRPGWWPESDSLFRSIGELAGSGNWKTIVRKKGIYLFKKQL